MVFPSEISVDIFASDAEEDHAPEATQPKKPEVVKRPLQQDSKAQEPKAKRTPFSRQSTSKFGMFKEEEKPQPKEEYNWVIVRTPKKLQEVMRRQAEASPNTPLKIPQEFIDSGIPCFGPDPKTVEFGIKEYHELVRLCIESEPLRNGENWVIPDDDE